MSSVRCTWRPRKSPVKSTTASTSARKPLRSSRKRSPKLRRRSRGSKLRSRKSRRRRTLSILRSALRLRRWWRRNLNRRTLKTPSRESLTSLMTSSARKWRPTRTTRSLKPTSPPPRARRSISASRSRISKRESTKRARSSARRSQTSPTSKVRSWSLIMNFVEPSRLLRTSTKSSRS